MTTATTARRSFPRAAGPVEVFALLLAAALASPAAAQANRQDVTISHAWMRSIIPGRPAGGYFDIANRGDEVMTITGATSPGCGMLMLHRSVSANGADRMEMVESVEVPAHGEMRFAPGGYHLMCMKPTGAVKPGKTVPVTLKFKDGASVTADFSVRDATGK